NIGDPFRKRCIAQKILDEISILYPIKEEVLYPAFHEDLKEDELFLRVHSNSSRDYAKLREIRRMNPANPSFEYHFSKFCAGILEHMEDEERNLFPKLEQLFLDEKILEEMEDLEERLTEEILN